MKIQHSFLLLIALSLIGCKNFDCIENEAAKNLTSKLYSQNDFKLDCTEIDSIVIRLNDMVGCKPEFTSYTKIIFSVKNGWKGYHFIERIREEKTIQKEIIPSNNWENIIDRFIENSIYFNIGDFDRKCILITGSQSIGIKINEDWVISNQFSHPNKCPEKHPKIEEMVKCYDVINNYTNISEVREQLFKEMTYH